MYEFQRGSSAAAATRNICDAVAKDIVCLNTAKLWFSRFRYGDFSLEDKPKSGRPTSINLDSLKEQIESDPNLTTRNLASTLNCTHGAVRYNFSKLGLVSKLGELVPHDQ